MKRSWPVLAVAVLAGSVGGGAAATPASSAPEHRGPGHRGPAYFAIGCGFSHRNNDDAIVSPGRRGVSHNHTYFGNTTTNASSTTTSLREAGTTTCRLRADTAAYWVPTLFAGDRVVNPLGTIAFYVRRTFGAIHPFPAGLKVIAGNAAATRPQNLNVANWSCGRGPVAASNAIPTCRDGRSLRLQVNFPNCWNGRSLDSSNHQSHMAYSQDGRCPASHPVPVPGLSLVVKYPGVSGRNAELASGGQFSAHADFVNAWDQRTLERLVNRYLNRFR